MKAHTAIFAILLFGALPAFMQSRLSKQEPSSPYTLELNAEEVVLNCTVLDSKGQLVKGLADLAAEAQTMIDDLLWWTAALKTARQA